MKKIHVTIAATFGFLAVAIGAFGAHGLKDVLTPEKLATFETGVLYHLVHSAVMLAIALKSDRNFKGAFLFIAAGTFLFSFSLYFYTVTGITALAMITPVGGVSFLAGWGLIIFRSLNKTTHA